MRMPRLATALMLIAALFATAPLGRAAEFKNWCRLTDTGPSGRVSAVVLNGAVYAMECARTHTDAEVDDYHYGNRMYRSTDGVHWTVKPIDWGNAPGDAKLVAFKNAIWALTAHDGSANMVVHRSADGESWETMSAGPPPRVGFALAAFNDQLWLIGGQAYNAQPTCDIWNTKDGVTWRQVGTQAPSGWSHGVVEFNHELWMAGGMLGSSKLGEIWFSTDGINWNPRSWTQSRDELSMTVWRDKLWIAGGETDWNYDDESLLPVGETSNVFSSLGNGPIWSDETNEPIGAIQGHASVVLNGRMLVIGGGRWNGANYLPSSSVWASPDPNYDAAAANPLQFDLPRRSGQNVSVEIRNTGKLPWTGAAGLGLKMISDPNGVWAATTTTLLLAPGTVVNPGETCRFELALDLSKVWKAPTLKVQMFQGNIGSFGMVETVSLNVRFDHEIGWARSGSLTSAQLPFNEILTATDKFLWCHNWRSADGITWIKTKDDAHNPWLSYNDQTNEIYNYYWRLDRLPKYAWFKNNLYLLEGSNIWKSADGMAWSHSDSKWVDFDSDYFDRKFAPIVTSCCVLGDRLYAMIGYDIDDGEYEYENLNLLWSTSDGSNWSKVVEFDQLASYGKMVAFKGKLWVFGGISKYSEHIDDEMEPYHVIRIKPEKSVYSSTDGKTWALAGNLPWESEGRDVVVYRDRLWAATENGSITSADGVHWEPTNPIPYGSRMQIFDDKVWVLDGGNVWRGSADAHSGAVSSTTLDFERVEVEARPQTRTISVLNCGTHSLGFVGSGARIVSSRPGEFTLAPAPNLSPISKSREIAITFNPKRIGPTSATLEITTNDAARPCYVVRLLGEAFSTRPLASGNILEYLLGISGDGRNLDQNGDGAIDIADCVWIQNSPVTVTSPTLSSIVALGRPFSIRWATRTQIGRVKIELARNHRPVATIDGDTANDGSYNATLAAVFVPDTNYSVIVSDAKNATVRAESRLFKIASNAFYMRYPHGGEILSRGARVPINWQGSFSAGVRNVRLELYKNDSFYKTIVAARAASEGDVYAWTIPADCATGDGFRVVVMDADHTATRAASEKMFSIK